MVAAVSRFGQTIVEFDESGRGGPIIRSMRSLVRLVVGLGLVAGAVAFRCVATIGGRFVADLGPHLPSLMSVDLLTGPVALVGVALIAATSGLGAVRRGAGTLALAAAIGWPAIKFGDLSPVIVSLSSRHGVHVHDVVILPFLAAALVLLAPWRAPAGPALASVAQTLRPRKLRNSVWTSAPSGASTLAPKTPGTRIMASIGFSPE